MPKKPPPPIKGSFGNGFGRYAPDTFDFVALHFWNARKTLPNGKVKDLGKAPIDAHWTTKPVVSRAVRRRCLAELRNMGIRLKADQLVIDIDPRNGGDASFAALCHDIGLDPDTWPRVDTGSGGVHYYLLLPDGFAVQEALEDYPGVEFKSVGRQVVSSGSRHPNGKLYRWSHEHPDIRDGVPLAPKPLLRVIRAADRADNNAGDGGQYSVEQLAAMLARLPVREFRDELKWRRLMFACHHATDGEGEKVFADWSASDPQFAGDSADVIKRWRSCRSKPTSITYLTLNHLLREHGANDLIPAPDVGDDFDDVEDHQDEFRNVRDARR